MSDAETEAAWDSAEYNARRADKAEARVADLEAEKGGLERGVLAQGAVIDDLRTRVADLMAVIGKLEQELAEQRRLRDHFGDRLRKDYK